MPSCPQSQRICARWLAVLLAAGALAGCGFQLARPPQLPARLAMLRVETAGSEQSDFYHGLRTALQRAGTQLTEQAGSGAPLLQVLEDGYSERVLTVSARNVPTAYEISYTVRLRVATGAQDLLPADAYTLTRDYSFDQTTLLAKERERDVLVASLAGELVDVVMQRLASL